jgi:hypothetical protein
LNDFAGEAERMRRAGDAQAAVEMAEAGLVDEPENDLGRIVLALALLDLGDLSCARERLERAFPAEGPVEPVALPLEPVGLGGDVRDDELERAFAEAETNPDEMMSANKVVQQTLENEHVEVPDEAGFAITDSPTYATETMASILEEQGRVGEAEALRRGLVHPGDDPFGDASNLSAVESIDAAGLLDLTGSTSTSGAEWTDAAVGPAHAERLRVLATLEGWLYNLRQQAERDPSELARTTRGSQPS